MVVLKYDKKAIYSICIAFFVGIWYHTSLIAAECLKPLGNFMRNCIPSLPIEMHYYFNLRQRKCLEFVFVNCQANNNDFSTEEECKSVCLRCAENVSIVPSIEEDATSTMSIETSETVKVEDFITIATITTTSERHFVSNSFSSTYTILDSTPTCVRTNPDVQRSTNPNVQRSTNPDVQRSTDSAMLCLYDYICIGIAVVLIGLIGLSLTLAMSKGYLHAHPPCL